MEEFFRDIDNQLKIISTELGDLDRIDTALNNLDGVLKEYAQNFQSLHDDLKFAINQLHISGITGMDFHDGEMIYR